MTNLVLAKQVTCYSFIELTARGHIHVVGKSGRHASLFHLIFSSIAMTVCLHGTLRAGSPIFKKKDGSHAFFSDFWFCRRRVCVFLVNLFQGTLYASEVARAGVKIRCHISYTVVYRI